MSVDHDRSGSLPEALGRRMRSAWSAATGWFATVLAVDDPPDRGSYVGSAEREVNEGDATGNVDGEPGSREPGRTADRGVAEIVPPEDRVVLLLDENGGGMRQAEIVTAVEWSESTVSRKLGTLESEGAITRVQIGREKLVFLPGNEPESLGSPWRDAVADAPQQV